MKRKEEIINEAAGRYPYDIDCFLAFIKGGEYADRTMLDRACEWLNDIDFDMEYWNQEDGFCKEEFITAFRQAMEGGAE